MSNENIKEQFLNRDRSVRVLSQNGTIRVVCIKNTQTALTAQNQHKLDVIPAFILGKALTSATMLSSFLKGEERVSIDISGNGLIRSVFAEALQVGETRGFIRLAEDYESKTIEKPEDILGIGLLKVSKVLYNKSEPVHGIIHLQAGDIDTDLAHYFNQSEQIPSAVLMDVTFDEEGKVNFSGGIIVQAMPGHTQKELEEVYNKISQIKSLSELFNTYKNPLDLLKYILPFEFNVVSSVQVDFFCRCSKNSFLSKLVTLDINEIKDMKKAGHNELICMYCNKHYYLDEADFNKIIEEAQARFN